MTKSTYNHPLAEEVKYFFRINPDEELTAHDCGIKFDVHPVTAADILGKMRNAGMLTSRRDGSRVVFSRSAP